MTEKERIEGLVCVIGLLMKVYGEPCCCESLIGVCKSICPFVGKEKPTCEPYVCWLKVLQKLVLPAEV